MKKFMKKFSGLFLALSFMVLVLPFTAYAAEGKLQFSDPTCAAGENVDINVRVITQGNNIGAYNIKVKYDPKMLKFEQGDNASVSDGIVTITYNGGNVPDTLHVLKFKALKNGETKLSVEGYEAKISSGEALTLTTGTSAVKIEGGTPVETDDEDTAESTENLDSEVEVIYNDNVYKLVSDFSDSDLIEGFEKTYTEFDGHKVGAMANEVTGQHIYVGLDENGEKVYLFEDNESHTLRLTENVPINRGVSIFIMDYPEDDKMPEHIKPTTMTLNEKKFMIWNNIKNQDFYYVYAFSNQGTKGYYEYDSVENTYQRANIADFVIEEKVEEEQSPLMEILSDNILIILIAAASLMIILLIIIIVLSVKLHKRGKKMKEIGVYDDVSYDEEITDDVNDYDEDDVYDIEFDDYDDGDNAQDSDLELEQEEDFGEELEVTFDEEPKPKKKSGKSKSSKKKRKNDDDDFLIDFIEI